MVVLEGRRFLMSEMPLMVIYGKSMKDLLSPYCDWPVTPSTLAHPPIPFHTLPQLSLLLPETHRDPT